MGSTLTVDNIVGATTAANVKLPAGTILQTVRGEYRTYTTFTSTSFVASSLTATITPKYNNSKILITVIANGVFNNGSAKYVTLSLYKASSSIAVLDSGVGYNTAGDEINYAALIC